MFTEHALHQIRAAAGALTLLSALFTAYLGFHSDQGNNAKKAKWAKISAAFAVATALATFGLIPIERANKEFEAKRTRYALNACELMLVTRIAGDSPRMAKMRARAESDHREAQEKGEEDDIDQIFPEDDYLKDEGPIGAESPVKNRMLRNASQSFIEIELVYFGDIAVDSPRKNPRRVLVQRGTVPGRAFHGVWPSGWVGVLGEKKDARTRAIWDGRDMIVVSLPNQIKIDRFSEWPTYLSELAGEEIGVFSLMSEASPANIVLFVDDSHYVVVETSPLADDGIRFLPGSETYKHAVNLVGRVPSPLEPTLVGLNPSLTEFAPKARQSP